MKYCSHCGAEINDDAVICPHCGCPTKEYNEEKVSQNDSLTTAIKVFLIIGCVLRGTFVISLAWCIPMTVYAFKKLDNHEPIGIGFKVCTLLFVDLIAGILLLCQDSE